MTKGFCQVKQNPSKTRKWWVGQAPTRILFFLPYGVFCVVFFVVHVSKKNWIGGWVGVV